MCVRERECVYVCVCKRENVFVTRNECVREGERECVYNRVCVCVLALVLANLLINNKIKYNELFINVYE